MERERPQRIQNNFGKEKMGIITLPDVRAYCMALVIRILWYWAWVSSRSVEQNREF